MSAHVQGTLVPHLCARQRQIRKSPFAVEVQAIYYIMEGNIYQAPTVQKLIKSRLDKFTHHLNNAFGERNMSHTFPTLHKK